MADEQGLLGDENIRCSDCYPTLCVYAKSLSCVRLFVTAWTVARQAPLSTGFSRQEYWRGLPCPPPGDLPGLGLKLASACVSCIAGVFFTH